jgi:hypothetical protein
MDYPVLKNDLGEVIKPSVLDFSGRAITNTIISGESEAGYQITRPRYTRNKSAFSVNYESVDMIVYTTLLTFFRSSAIGKANFFNWTHPATSTVYVMRFNNDDLTYRQAGNPNKVSFQFELLEV